MPRSRSRFAEEAQCAVAGNCRGEGAVAAGAAAQEPERGGTKPAPGPQGRPRKTVAFAGVEPAAEAAAAQLAQPAAAPAAVPVESKRSRRMTRAMAAAAPLADTQPAAVASQEQQRQALQAISEEQEVGSAAAELEAVQPVKPTGGRRRTQAVIGSAAQVHASSPVLAPLQTLHVQQSDPEQAEPAGGCREPALPTACTEQPGAAPDDKPRRRGRCAPDYGTAVGRVLAPSRSSPITLAHMPRLPVWPLPVCGCEGLTVPMHLLCVQALTQQGEC